MSQVRINLRGTQVESDQNQKYFHDPRGFLSFLSCVCRWFALRCIISSNCTTPYRLVSVPPEICILEAFKMSLFPSLHVSSHSSALLVAWDHGSLFRPFANLIHGFGPDWNILYRHSLSPQNESLRTLMSLERHREVHNFHVHLKINCNHCVFSLFTYIYKQEKHIFCLYVLS